MEKWKTIEYAPNYRVSTLGQVSNIYGHVLCPFENEKGYLKIDLRVNGKRKRFFVHRLVADAFINNPNDLPQVNHKNENKKDNRVNNLERCTAAYNINFGSRSEKVAKRLGKKLYQYDLNGKLMKVHNSLAGACKEFGYDMGKICECLKGVRKQYKGFMWSR